MTRVAITGRKMIADIWIMVAMPKQTLIKTKSKPSVKLFHLVRNRMARHMTANMGIRGLISPPSMISPGWKAIMEVPK